MKLAIATVALAATAGPACAQAIILKPLIEARLRGELVDQAGLADTAEAVTMRVRAGVSATRGGFGALVEVQGNLAVADAYFDGLEGPATRPLIADPQSIALYRAQIHYRDEALAVTAGRQRIALDDERFVGAIGFRQNGQTFDAIRFEWRPAPRVRADLSYAWAVRTIWGIDGAGARPRAISGDNIFATLSYATPAATLSGFAYLIDQDEAAVQGYRLSSQTYGVRLAGVRLIGKAASLSYQASWASQSDYRRNPNRYRAAYYLLDAGLTVSRARLGVGYEVLGAAEGAALTSFQTPLATGFKFKGWADNFLTTPPEGIHDLYGTFGYGAKRFGPFTGVSLQAAYHRFDSDRLARRYGSEVDLLASGKLGKYTLALRYARYDADRFATDTRKAWVQLDWAF
ncbi:alginate export family protein [Sphingomonas sp. M1-B02]|uniref:alginate export family protein n=1 Tax=Sphingomonas sp. M1-B02 TaxID=3114300 RepID=UPI002240A010|nr:hypothetical protein [Sphingomonas sp. S6-11]UZK66685.1 alginate export family protein [Sphingomonas sp. S6-11]